MHKFKELFKSKYLGVVLAFLISIPFFISMIKPGFFPMFDDMQVIRLEQMHKCILDLQIPCRWVPDLGYGYGYPLYQYYAPLPFYIMELFHLLGISFINSVKTGFIISVIFSSIAFYKLSRYFFTSKISVVTTIFYVYVPFRASDIYVRGAMGEAWGMFALPFLLWGFEYLRKNRNLTGKLFFAFSISLFLISHNLTVLMGLPLIMLWITIGIWKSKKNHVLFKKVLLSGLLGFSLSAFFVIPLIFERNLVHLDTLTQGYFDYVNHFLDLNQIILSTEWGYGPSIVGSVDNVFLGIGPIHFFAATLGMVSLIKHHKFKIFWLSLGALFFIYLFLTHSKSIFIWQNFKFLEFVQFPWRFIFPASFIASLTYGNFLRLLNKKRQIIVLFASVLLIFIFYGSFYQPKDWHEITDIEKLSGENRELQVTASIYDYLPKSAQVNPPDPAPDSLIELDRSMNILSSKRGTNWYRYEVVVSNAAGAVIPTYDFPIWKVYINGNPTNYERIGELGLLKLQIPEGRHTVYAYLEKSAPRKLGDIISIIGITVFLLLFIKRKAEWKK